MADDDLTSAPDQITTAFLADVRMQADDHHLVPAAMVYPLLGAVEAVLKLHARQDKPAITHTLCPEHAGWMDHAGHLFRTAVELCPNCTVTEKHVCTHCRNWCPDNDEWPCPTVRAVTAELIKGEATP
jgi:hypothetical protein